MQIVKVESKDFFTNVSNVRDLYHNKEIEGGDPPPPTILGKFLTFVTWGQPE